MRKLILALVALQIKADECEEPESNPDFLDCQKHFYEIYAYCVLNCAQDPSCLSVCARELEKNIIKKGSQEIGYYNLILLALNLLFCHFVYPF